MIMDKEQQIEEMATFIHGRRDKNGSEKTAKALFEAGYRKVPKYAVILSPEEREEEIKANNEERKERENELLIMQMACCSAQFEVERLQKENEALKRVDNRVAFCKAYDQIRAENKRLKAVNERFASNMKNVLEIEKENAVKAFAEHLKKYAIKTNSPAWGLIEFVEVSDIDKLLLTDY
jgi:hypothetical protein